MKIIPDTIYVEMYPGASNYTLVKNKKPNKKHWNGSKYVSVTYDEIKNTPQTGIYIKGNNLEIHDPRGFANTIPPYRIGDLLEGKTIIDGELIGEFVYGFDGTKINVIEYNSDIYNEYEKGDVVKTSKTSKIKDFEIGGVYENGHGEEYTYLGVFTYFLFPGTKIKKFGDNEVSIDSAKFINDNDDQFYCNFVDLSSSTSYKNYTLGKQKFFLYQGKIITLSSKMYIKKYNNPLYANYEKNKIYIENNIDKLIYDRYGYGPANGDVLRIESSDVITKKEFYTQNYIGNSVKMLKLSKDKVEYLSRVHPQMMVYVQCKDSVHIYTCNTKKDTYEFTETYLVSGSVIYAKDYDNDPLVQNARKFNENGSLSVRKHIKVENPVYFIPVLSVNPRDNLILYPNGKFETMF